MRLTRKAALSWTDKGLWNITAHADPQTVFRTRSPVIKKCADQALDS